MLTVSIKQIPLVSFALAVNNVAVISNITVRNNTPNNYEGLKVRITFDPEFADTVVEHIVSLPAHESWKKPDIQPSINTSYLCNLTEKIKVSRIRKGNNLLHIDKSEAEGKIAEKLMQSLICGTFFEISSTEVKNSMEKRAFRHHIIEKQGLHPAVSEYIRKRGLYLIGKENL